MVGGQIASETYRTQLMFMVRGDLALVVKFEPRDIKEVDVTVIRTTNHEGSDVRPGRTVEVGELAVRRGVDVASPTKKQVWKP